MEKLDADSGEEGRGGRRVSNKKRLAKLMERAVLQVPTLAVLMHKVGQKLGKTGVAPDTDLAGYPDNNFAGYWISEINFVIFFLNQIFFSLHFLLLLPPISPIF